MLKRGNGRGPHGAESADDDGNVVSERARKQPKLLDPQTPRDGINATAATLDLQGIYNQDGDLDRADDFTWDSTYDAEWSSSTRPTPDLLGTPPVPAASQSGIVDEELPVQASSAALVYYGMVIAMHLPVVHWRWHS